MSQFKPINFKFRSGDTFIKKLQVNLLSSGVVSAYDLSAHTIKFTVRDRIGGTPELFQATLTDGVGYNDFDTGKLQLEIPKETTDDLPLEPLWDIEATSPGGRRTTLAAGKLEREPDVT